MREERGRYLNTRARVVTIQSVWRGRRERVRYERLRASTVLCQAAVRGWIVRRRRSRQTQAVIIIQQALRRVIQVMLIIIFFIFHLTFHLMAGSKSEEAVR